MIDHNGIARIGNVERRCREYNENQGLLMSTIHARFENGVFKPIGAIELPDNCEVEFEPRIVVTNANDDRVLDKVYEMLGRRFNSGITDTAERHNEHQP